MAGSAASSGSAIAKKEGRWRSYIKGIQAKDPGSLAMLYDETSGVIYGLALRMLDDPAVAEEVMLGVYHHVWDSVEAIDPAQGSILASLALLTRSRAMDQIRRAHAPVPIRGSWAPPAATSGTGDTLLAERQRVGRTLEALAPEARTAVELAFFGGLTAAEVATALQAPVSAIKKRIHAGMGKLREALTSAGSRENGN